MSADKINNKTYITNNVKKKKERKSITDVHNSEGYIAQTTISILLHSKQNSNKYRMQKE